MLRTLVRAFAQGVHPVIWFGPSGIERSDHQGVERGALPLAGPMGSEVGVEFRPEVYGHPDADAPLSGAGFEGQFGEPDAVRYGDAFVPAEGMLAGAEALSRDEGPELEGPPSGLQDAHEQPHAGRDFEVVFRGAGLAQDGLHLKATHAVAGGGHDRPMRHWTLPWPAMAWKSGGRGRRSRRAAVHRSHAVAMS